MKWSDKSIFQVIEQYKNDFLYSASLKTHHDRILNKNVNCVIDKLAVFFLPMSFAGKVHCGSGTRRLAPVFGARIRRRKQTPDNEMVSVSLT